MEKRILYYTWNENSCEDCVTSLRALGAKVRLFEHRLSSYVTDGDFSEALKKELQKGYDLIFTFNFFPIISDMAEEMGLPYVFWVYDSPHHTLESESLKNSCNKGFLFDRALLDRYNSEGISNLFHMPLPCNTDRLNKVTSRIPSDIIHSDISFIGSLYTGQKDLYSRVSFLPDELRGYLSGIMQAQKLIYGLDLPDELMTDDICETMSRYVKADLGPGFNNCRYNILRDIVRTHVTAMERKELLILLAEFGKMYDYSVDLYSEQPLKGTSVNYRGIAENSTQMPQIFAASKINLNLTLRSIKSGIPLRVIDILGSGGFCMTNYQAELPEYFECGQDIVWFESREDLLEKAVYYLNNDEERSQIAYRGHELAAKIFDYKVLLPRILAQI
ncbi:MAG: DUF3880 domain-containing protein [Lachnospiraceae bacterium]|nr:DUF3880 domain-containing protein [Lachnospiraceae bacterium]